VPGKLGVVSYVPSTFDYSHEDFARADRARELLAHLAISVFMGSILSHLRQTMFVWPVLAVIAIKRFLHCGQRLKSIAHIHFCTIFLFLSL
jgi:hypothetical protein